MRQMASTPLLEAASMHLISTNGLLVLSNKAHLIMVDDKQPEEKAKECTHVYELVEGCVWKLREVINRKDVIGRVQQVGGRRLEPRPVQVLA